MPQDDQAEADLDTTQTGEEQETVAAHDPIDGATNLAEYNALLDGQLEPPAEAAEEVAPEIEEEEAGNGEETEAAAQAAEEAAAAEAEVKAAEEAAAAEEESKSQDRFRIRANDEVEATALLLRKRNPTWSLSECIEKSKVVHGTKEESAAEQETTGPKTVAEAKASIAELRVAKATAMEALEFTEAARLDAEIDVLRDTIDELKDVESRESQLEQQAFIEEVGKSKVKAVEYYADAAKADSPLVKRMQEIDAQMKDDENPLYFSPNKPFKLAQMAANDLGIAPRNPKAAAAPAKPAAPATRRPVQPASGSARTTASTPLTEKIDQAVAEVKDEASYEKLLAEVSS